MSKNIVLLNGPHDCQNKTNENVTRLLDLAKKYHINLDEFENVMCATEKSSELFNSYDKELAALNRKYWEKITQLSPGDQEQMGRMLETYDAEEFKKYVDMDKAFSCDQGWSHQV